MTSTPPTSRAGLATAALVAAFLAPFPEPAAAVVEPLTLRISDTVTVPGGLAAVVLRTYAPRSIRQGQVCFHRPAGGAAGGAIVALEDVVVFSRDDDATVEAHFDPAAQAVDVTFDSPAAGINWADGPFAVFFLRLSDDVAPGASFELVLDTAETALVDAVGAAVVIEARSGTLAIRAPGAPVSFGVDGDEGAPGGRVTLAVETAEGLPLGSGQVELIYDPALFRAPPTVRMDPRHGAAVFVASHPAPGRLWVGFSSPDGSLNRVPGGLVEVAATIRPGVPVGTRATISLDPAGTWLADPAGAPIALVLGSDVVEVVADSPLFRSGFESGDLSAWAAAVP